MYPQKHSETYYDPHQRLRAFKITPGEYCVVNSGEVIVTVLGSCVIACIRDRRQGIGGMYQFMVVNVNEDQPLNRRMENMATAGMDSFIDHLVNMGAEEGRLEAKVFGGGNILNGMQRNNAGARSAQFLRGYLANRNIPVVADDMLDIYPRKVYFFPETGEVLVKKLPESRYFCRKIFSGIPLEKNRQKLRDRLCLRRPDSSASPRFDPARGSKPRLSHDLTPFREALQVFSASLRKPARRYGYRGLKIFTSLSLRFQDFQRRI
ncbi:hypothetical protein [Methylomonas denitrificans]|nr:hypothetical protein [Methylomonas denitrificans]